MPLFLMTCHDEYQRVVDERAHTAEIWQLMGSDDLDVAAFAAGDVLAEQIGSPTDSQRYDFVARADDERTAGRSAGTMPCSAMSITSRTKRSFSGAWPCSSRWYSGP